MRNQLPGASYLALEFWLAIALLAGVGVHSACAADLKSKPDVANSAAQHAAPTLAATNSPNSLVIDGERFTVRQMIDRQQGGIPVCVFVAPEKWKDTSQVNWNYGNHSSPVKLAATIENPTNQEAFFAFPAAEFFCLRPETGYYRPGQDVGGLIFGQRQQPAPTLAYLVQQARGGQPNFQVIGVKDLPGLPKALQLPASPNQRGVGLKVTYDLESKPVEEEFYGVYYSVDIPYDGPQGRTWQNNWGLTALHSFRAARGTLDRRRDIFAAMARSFRPNPAWQQRLAAINTFLAEQFNRQLQAGYDSITAAANLSKQISANNDAMIGSFERQRQTARITSSGSASRSSADKFDDYIRGVDVVDDPFYGTSQHANTEQYHWTDGYGTYRHSNDATYNPNQNENGNWQLMPATR